MKILFTLLLTAFLYAASRTHTNYPAAETALQKVKAYKQQFSLGCAPELAGFDLNDPANAIPLLDSWGDYRMPVTAGNDSSRIYFEQGINMY